MPHPPCWLPTSGTGRARVLSSGGGRVDRQTGPCSQIVEQQTATHHAGGLLSVLWTADRSALTVLYGTNASGRLQDHTGTQVRVAAMGQLASRISGVHDQTDLYWLMAKALGARSAGEAQVLKTAPR